MKPLEMAMRINEELEGLGYKEKYKIKQISDSETVRSKILIVVGLEGGAGATSVAEGLAQEFALYYGKKVCHISFDSFGGGENLRKLLYYWKKGGVLHKIAPDYFIPDENNVFGIFKGRSIQGINPLLMMDVNDAVQFIEDVKTKLDFDYIIVDMSILLYKLYAEILGIAEKTVLVSKENAEKIVKIAEENKTKSTICVLNFADRYKDCVKDECDKNVTKDNESLKRLEISTIEVDEEIAESSCIKVDGVFGIGIKNLAERIEF